MGPRPEWKVLSSIEPTVIMVWLVPGAVILFAAGPLLPAAATTTIPLRHIFSTCLIRLRVFSISILLLGVVPNDIFATLILYRSLLLIIQFVPSITLPILPLPYESSTFTDIIWLIGAMPLKRPLLAFPLPAIIPETWVPCPLSS